MRVSHLALDDFRSWKRVVLELPAGPLVFLGHNGQGKTNLVEAIAYLSTFSSHRVSAEGALVRIPTHEEEPAPARAFVRVKTVRDEDREQVVELEIVRGKANRARINRANVRPREILGLVRTVVFAPEDLQLVRGDPSVRRAFLDEIAIQMHPLYAQVKADFDRVLRQRAAIMKHAQSQLRRGRTPDLSTIEVWDERFAELSAKVSATRFKVVSLLSEPAARAYDDVADSHRHLELSFDASIDRTIGTNPDDPGSGDLGDVEAQQRRLLAAFDRMRDQEIERGVNLVGAHRDDLGLKLGRMPVKGFASHGESWSVALALRLGCFDLLRLDGQTPILILDDVFAELDSKRRAGLATRINAADQVIITAAVEADVPPELDSHVLKIHWDPLSGSQVLFEEPGVEESAEPILVESEEPSGSEGFEPSVTEGAKLSVSDSARPTITVNVESATSDSHESGAAENESSGVCEGVKPDVLGSVDPAIGEDTESKSERRAEIPVSASSPKDEAFVPEAKTVAAS